MIIFFEKVCRALLRAPSFSSHPTLLCSRWGARGCIAGGWDWGEAEETVDSPVQCVRACGRVATHALTCASACAGGEHPAPAGSCAGRGRCARNGRLQRPPPARLPLVVWGQVRTPETRSYCGAWVAQETPVRSAHGCTRAHSHMRTSGHAHMRVGVTLTPTNYTHPNRQQQRGWLVRMHAPCLLEPWQAWQAQVLPEALCKHVGAVFAWPCPWADSNAHAHACEGGCWPLLLYSV